MRKYIDKALQLVGIKSSTEKEPLFGVTALYPPMPTPSSCFYSKVCRVKDADTVVVEINKFHGQRQEFVIRLLGVDAREIRGPDKAQGLIDKVYAESWVKEAETNAVRDAFVVQTVAQDKYGRWLGWVWRTCDSANLNTDLLLTGHADEAPAEARMFLLRDIAESMKGMEIDDPSNK